MNVGIYSREAIESVIADGKFPENTAVISFYDPAIKRIDKAYSHVDYSGICNIVYYSELDDLDLEVLKDRGYTYDTYFPEADEIAAFIYRAYRNGMEIICQCEYGQSRSAGCAAAILEHFYHRGISVFTDYRYYPNQFVYHKVFDALERQKVYSDNRYYFAASADTIKSHLVKLRLPGTLLSGYQPDNGDSAADLKCTLEGILSEQHLLCHSDEEIITALLEQKKPVYAAFTVKEPFNLYDRYLWTPYSVGTYFRYGCENIPVQIWFSRYRASSGITLANRRKKASRSYRLSFGTIQSFSFFGKLSWDGKRKMIDAIPLIITNIEPR